MSATTPEDELIDLVVAKINAGKSILKSAKRAVDIGALSPNAFPIALVVYLQTNFEPTITSVGGRAGSTVIQGCIQTNEFPIIGIAVYALDESTALSAIWEAKNLISGYGPDLSNVQVMYPLHPVEKMIKDPQEKMYLIAVPMEMTWQTSIPLSS